MDIQHMKTVKQLNVTDMTKTTKLTMRLVIIYIQSINARTVTTKTRSQSNLTKSASRGPIPRLGVTPGGRKLYH